MEQVLDRASTIHKRAGSAYQETRILVCSQSGHKNRQSTPAAILKKKKIDPSAMGLVMSWLGKNPAILYSVRRKPLSRAINTTNTTFFRTNLN